MSEIRIGVFVCHCGSNIGSIIDVPALTEYSKYLPNVVFTQDNLYTCSETGLLEIKKGIKENNLNRVVVAACTPRTHEPLFRGICVEMGLNQYFFEFVNIREQISWVHQKPKLKKKAFQKAQDLIRMGVARASKLEALKQYEIDVHPSVLVIGGGISGMSAALNLANQGFNVRLVERDEKLGGHLNKLYKIYPKDIDPSEVLSIKGEILSNDKIKIHLSTQINKIKGFIGNFEVSLKKETDPQEINFKAGAIIIATGTKVLKPQGLYNYNGKTVITQQELEYLLMKKENIPKNIVMIQCVGARNEERRYCSDICCMTALKNARILKNKNKEINITILYRDIHATNMFQEDLYREVRGLGVIFIRFNLNNPPNVNNSCDRVTIFNESLNENIEIKSELVILSTPLIPQPDTKEISQMLKIPIEENGFYLEAHVKLRPVDFSNDGIFLCGSAKWPTNISNAIAQGLAAASRVLRIISKDKLTVEGATAQIDREKCIGCEICIKICPYMAIFKDEEEKVHVRPALCKSCGLCSSTCPEKAIIMKHYKDEQVFSQIDALMEVE